MEEKNMELWNQVCKTDPKFTKRVDQRGGFTAICAQSQIKRATELWGSYGGKWGVKKCNYLFVEIIDKQENVKKVDGIALKAVFYYPSGEFEIATDMSYRPQGDCMKKLLTDLTTKALSKLGFNSDVFEGKFDDNKYVQELNQKFGNDVKKEREKEPQKGKKGKWNFTDKQKQALEKIAISKYATPNEKDEVLALIEKATKESEKGNLFDETRERISHWLKSWFGTQNEQWKDGERHKREEMERKERDSDKDNEDLPF